MEMKARAEMLWGENDSESLSGLGVPQRLVLAVILIALFLQPNSIWLRGCVSWEIVDPATNHLGWYLASLQDWLSAWVWLTVEEQWLLALESWHQAILLDSITAAMAVAAVRRPHLMTAVVHITAFRIFL